MASPYGNNDPKTSSPERATYNSVWHRHTRIHTAHPYAYFTRTPIRAHIPIISRYTHIAMRRVRMRIGRCPILLYLALSGLNTSSRFIGRCPMLLYSAPLGLHILLAPSREKMYSHPFRVFASTLFVFLMIFAPSREMYLY
jgi:hypothetical protein